MTPRWVHECSGCKFIGAHDVYDVYLHDIRGQAPVIIVVHKGEETYFANIDECLEAHDMKLGRGKSRQVEAVIAVLGG